MNRIIEDIILTDHVIFFQIFTPDSRPKELRPQDWNKKSGDQIKNPPSTTGVKAVAVFQNICNWQMVYNKLNRNRNSEKYKLPYDDINTVATEIATEAFAFFYDRIRV